MEFFDKLTKKASETYKGAAEKTSKLAKEAKLKMKINDNKSKINDLYEEIGKRVYQKHIADEELCIKEELEEECKQIDELSKEIEGYHKEIVELSNGKICENCKEEMSKEAKFCPKCGTEQPEVEEKEEDQIEVEFIPDESIEEAANEPEKVDEVTEVNTENSEDSEENK